MNELLHPIHILAVDDDAESRDLLKAVLEPESYRIKTVGSCAEARRALAESAYEVLIADLKLPDGDGIDLLTFAREKDPGLVAIVLTAYATTGSAVAALHHGAYDYISKPCPPRILAAAVRRAVEKQRLTRALAERTAEIEALNRDLNQRVLDKTQQIHQLNERLQKIVADLIDSNDGRVRFMETLAHELKNPLSVVRGYASFLLSRPAEEWSKDELERVSQSIYRNTDFLKAMLDELMEATSVSKHKIVLRREPLDAYEEARHAVEAFHFQAQEKGIELKAECPAGPSPVLDADRVRLRQMLSNLIANALKFTPSGGRVTVCARPRADAVEYVVEDTGRGIPEKHLSKIFDRFYQAEPKTHHKGLGLGLEIARGLVTLHGGSIWAESETGRGSKFHFTLPWSAPQSPASPTDAAPRAEDPRDSDFTGSAS